MAQAANYSLPIPWRVAAEPLTLNGSGTTGAGALRLVSGNASWSGPITVASASTIGVDSGVLVLDGAINLGSALTFTGGGTEQVDGVVSGSGDLLKNGAGTLYLTAANTFSGTTTINAGTLIPQNTAAFGATGVASGTVVMAGAAILLNDATGLNIGAETLTLNGSGVAGAGALESMAGDNSWSGDIVLATNSTVSVDANTLTLSGAISESGGARALTKSGVGTLILGGEQTATPAPLRSPPVFCNSPMRTGSGTTPPSSYPQEQRWTRMTLTKPSVRWRAPGR